MQFESEYNVLAPGPVNLHPKVREALALPMIHHRTPEFDKILSRVLNKLKFVFKTTQPVYILSSTGSGGMEALLVNTLSPGDKVLSLDTGKFGERWGEIAKAFGADIHTLKTTWGEAISPDDVAKFLNNNPDTKIVLCQACETSTGVLNPIKEIGQLINNMPQTLFLVDGITALGAMKLPFDEWQIDGLVGGSQKAFMLPTGLSFISFSKKAWQAIPNSRCPKFYFDIQKESKANQNGETFFSSNVTLIRALDVVLDLIFKTQELNMDNNTGLEELFSVIEKRAQFTRQFTKDLGFNLYTSSPANSLSALLVPQGFDGQKIRLLLEQKYKITIMGGQDQAKGKIIRIGHMGNITWEQMQNLIIKLYETMLELNPEYKIPKKAAQLKNEMKAWVALENK
jgi:aspartate aminotransferase-like enzyme